MTNLMEGIALSQAASLDALWHQAETLGRVAVDHAIGDSAYRVRICFTRSTGSTVWAEGRDGNIAFALENAISEAQTLRSLT